MTGNPSFTLRRHDLVQYCAFSTHSIDTPIPLPVQEDESEEKESTMPRQHTTRSDGGGGDDDDPQEHRRRLRKQYIDKLNGQTCTGVRDVLDLLKEKQMDGTLRRYRNMLKRNIFVPQPRIEPTSLTAANEKDRDSLSNNANNAVVYEDFSAWDDYLAQAERTDPLTRKRRQTRPKRQKVYRGIHQTLSLLRAMKETDWSRIDKLFRASDNNDDFFEIQEFVDQTQSDAAMDDDDKNDWAKEEQSHEKDVQDEVSPDICENEEESDSSDSDELYSLEDIQSALNAASNGEFELDAEYYNLLLARASVALDLSSTECQNVITRIAKDLNQSRISPDSVTSEILIRVVSQRLGAPHSSLGFVKELVEGPSLRSADSLRAAFQLCLKVDDEDLARRLWECYVEQDASLFPLSVDIVACHLTILMSNFLQEEAVDVLKFALKQNRKSQNKPMDDMFKKLCYWPLWNRDGSQDNSLILESVLEVLSNETTYKPHWSVWKSLIFAASNNPGNKHERTTIAYAAMKELLVRFPNNGVDGPLTKIGLDVCQSVVDARVAVDLFTRRIADVIYKLKKEEENALLETVSDRFTEGEEHVNSPDGSAETAMQETTNDGEREDGKASRQSNRVSSGEAVAVMRICVDSRAIAAVQSVLSLTEEFEDAFHETLYPRMCSMAIQAFVGRGEIKLAEESFRKLIERGFKPLEEDFGAVMHGRVLSGDFEGAEELFDSMDDTDGNVCPGPTCYNAMILGCIQRSNLEDALSWHDRMLNAGIEPSASSYSGLLLAYFKTGGKAAVVELLNGILKTDAKVAGDTVLVAIQILLPELDGEQTFHDIRQRIRSMIDEQREPKDLLLSLMRSIRVAELLEMKNVESANTDSEATIGSWRTVLSDLIKVVESEMGAV